MQLRYCLGCNDCFKKGLCRQDELDDMGTIKQHLLKADIIIFASPVYSNNVTAPIKCVIDRLSYWSHLFYLVGKKSMSLATTSNSGGEFVSNYLSSMLTCYGSNSIKQMVFSKGQYRSGDFTDLDAFIDKLVDCIDEVLQYKSVTNERLELYFKAMQSIFLKSAQGPSQTHELQHWKKSGLLIAESLEAWISSNR